MNEVLKEKCDLLVNNKNAISKVFTWDSSYMSSAAAIIFTGAGKQADEARLRECEKIVKENTNMLSVFRGNNRVPLICKMALSDDPKAYFDKVEKIYGILNKSKFFDNEYRILAAMTLIDHGEEATEEESIKRMEEIFERMKKEHPFLTSNEDIPYAMMLALSDYSVDDLIKEMETIYTIMKKFSAGDAVQSLSHVLCLDGTPAEEKCDRVMALYEELKNKKHKYGKSYELATLGVLTLSDASVEELANQVIEADDYLKEQKGFGDFVLGATMRRMFAAQLVAQMHKKADDGNGNVVISSMLAYAVAMETAMIAIMCACMVSTTSSSST